MIGTKKSLIIVASLLMFVNTGTYFYAAYGQMQEGSEPSDQLQTLFFAVSGIIFVPLGIWMLKNKIHSRGPYVLSAIIAVSLILLYIASRTINLPAVGIQEDIGPLDIFSKVIQGGVIVLCLMLLPHIKREQDRIISVKQS